MYLDPEHAQFYFNRALTYSSKGEYKQAIKDYDKEISLHLEASVIYTNRAFSYISLQENDKAIADLSKAIELNPEDDKIYFFRSLIHFRQGYYMQAIEDFKKAVNLHPKYFTGTDFDEFNEYLYNFGDQEVDFGLRNTEDFIAFLENLPSSKRKNT